LGRYFEVVREVFEGAFGGDVGGVLRNNSDNESLEGVIVGFYKFRKGESFT
jgi:hypothetical protein